GHGGVDEQCHVGQQARQAVIDEHEGHHDSETDGPGHDALAYRILAQGSADLALLDHLHRHRERAVLELGDDIPRLLQREVAGDHAAIFDARVDHRIGEHHVVEHDGQVLADVLLGKVAEDLGGVALPAKVDLRPVALIEAHAQAARIEILARQHRGILPLLDLGARWEVGRAGIEELEQPGLAKERDRPRAILLALDAGNLHDDTIAPLELNDRLGRPEGIHPLLDDRARCLHLVAGDGLPRRQIGLQQHLQAALEDEPLHDREVEVDVPAANAEVNTRIIRPVNPGGDQGDEGNDRQHDSGVAAHATPFPGVYRGFPFRLYGLYGRDGPARAAAAERSC